MKTWEVTGGRAKKPVVRAKKPVEEQERISVMENAKQCFLRVSSCMVCNSWSTFLAYDSCCLASFDCETQLQSFEPQPKRSCCRYCSSRHWHHMDGAEGCSSHVGRVINGPYARTNDRIVCQTAICGVVGQWQETMGDSFKANSTTW